MVMPLSEEEKRQRKSAYQKEYVRRTNNAAGRKSQKKTQKVFAFKFSYNTDGKLIEFLDGLENRNGYIRDLIYADMDAIKRENRMRPIPLFGNAFAAGPGEPDFGNGLETYEIPENQRGDFAVRIHGDSMEPWLPDGSIQIGVKGKPRDGDVAALLIDGAFYVKQVCVDPYGNLYLFSLNRARKNLDFDVKASSDSTVLCFGTILTRERHPLPLD
jgi:phage repressor protein C with HTH and peptisase S24 domain